ncbi:MAG: chorismate mutase [Patescibacteria group bacterium]|nr:chorismate mutase [Patescibacteria group bacterium]
MKKLEDYRKQIDKIDEKLIKTLSKRFFVVKKIGKLKKKLNLPPLDKKRWNEIIKSRTDLGEKIGLSKKLIKKIYQAIHDYSLKIEKKF